MTAQSGNPRLPLWLRIAFYAEEENEYGHRRLYAGELSDVLESSPKYVSRAIATAVTKGVLKPESSARCLVSVKAKPSLCKAHRKDK